MYTGTFMRGGTGQRKKSDASMSRDDMLAIRGTDITSSFFLINFFNHFSIK